MTDNPDKDFETAIEILDGKMDDTLTFYVSKKIKTTITIPRNLYRFE